MVGHVDNHVDEVPDLILTTLVRKVRSHEIDVVHQHLDKFRSTISIDRDEEEPR